VSDLDIAVGAARAAGALLREAFRDVESLSIATKTSATDPVSEADEAAERLIREHLPEGDAVLGEEGGATGEPGGRRWIVDPLDGTVNFLFGIPQWCVSIALEGEVGVIFDPMHDELWTVERGGPPMLNGRPVSGSAETDLSVALLVTGYAYAAEARAAQLPMTQRLLPKVRDIRRMGSAALDLAWMSAGRFDGYFEHGVKAWDIAAGALLCEAAGLVVRELPAEPPLEKGILVAPASLVDALEEVVLGKART
jgi:myo-inositol-1(or 4)-monophosphatase